MDELFLFAEDLATRHAMDMRGDFLHPLYVQSVNLASKIAVHFQYGTEPGDLIEKRRPSEPANITEYRKETYEQITFPWANKIVGVQRGSLFNEELYRVEYPENTPVIISDYPFKDYIEYLPNGVGNFFEYIQEFVIQKVNIDPNGWFAILPKNPDQVFNEDNERIQSDISEPHEPYPEFIPSKNVIDFTGDYVLVESSMKSEIGEYSEGKIYFLFLKDVTLKITQTGLIDGKPIFETLIYHLHNYGEMMIRQIGGISHSTDEKVLEGSSQIVYLSHVSPTIPFFNKVLKETSDIDAAIVNHLFPAKYEATVPCPTCEGKGEIFHSTANDYVTCTKCEGGGHVALSNLSTGSGPFSGFGVEPNEDGSVKPPAGYITNSDVVAAIGKAREEVMFNLKEAFSSVGIFEQRSTERTAQETRDDSKFFHNFLTQCAQTVFPLCQWILDSINHSRYHVLLGDERLKENRIIIHPPTDFDTITPMLFLEKIFKAKEAGAPGYMISKLFETVTPSMFGNNSRVGKRVACYIKLDPLAGMNADEILASQAAGRIFDPIDLLIHSNITKLVDQAIDENKMFADLSFKEQKEVISKLAENINEPAAVL